jgi:ATP-binding cassette subfamily F protein uup
MHVHSFGKRFLFTPERLQLPVRMLSGGEKARILIARLMTQSADILLLDEPTNDLDIETLEILEESLRNFPGAIVFITHDRYMLNDLATIFLGLGFGGDEYFFADYYQCERYLQEMSQKKAPKAKTKTVSNNAPKKQKLSYKEKTEYQNIEKKIQKAEAEVERLHKLLESPTLSDDTNRLQEVCNELKKNQDEIERLYMRWQELESKL